MSFTKSEVRAMSEDELRVRVLIPLFKAMGYEDVHEYHAGAMELGKDILMWKPDEIRGRINFAVVAKAKRITGAVTGKAGAGEVMFQINQCFGRPYDDNISMEERHIDRCLVVSSHEIKKEAVQAIKSGLEQTQHKNKVDFVNGDKLWELVEKYLPPSAALTKLEEAGEVFESASDHHRIVASLRGKNLVLSTEPKHDRAFDKEPLEFRIKLAYAGTSEGKKARAEFEHHIETGAPVRIRKEFITQIAVPEFLRQYLSEPAEIELGPRQLRKAISVNFLFALPGPDPIRLDNVHLVGVQVGTSEVTFENTNSPTPYRVRLRLTRDGRLEFGFTANMEGENARVQLQTAQLQSMLAAGCHLTIESADTQLALGKGEVVAGTMEPPDPALLRLLEDLVLIQTRTGVALTLPNREVPGEEVAVVRDLAQRLTHTGQEGTINSLRVSLRPDMAEALCSDPELLQKNVVTLSYTEAWTILDKEVVIKGVETVISGLRPPESELDKVRAWLAGGKASQLDEIELVQPGEPVKATRRYPNVVGGASPKSQ